MISSQHKTVLPRMGVLLPALLVWLCLLGSAVQAREIRVGLYENEPKIFADTKGQPAGIFVDLLQAVAAQEGWQLTYVACAWEQCLQELEAGQLDLMPDVALSEQRQRLFDFHATPALHSWSQLYQRAGGKLHSIRDLNGYRVAVLKGSIQNDGLQQLEKDYGIHIERLETTDWHDAMDAVRNHQAGAAATNHFFGEFHAAEFQLEATPITFQPVQLYFAAPKGRNGDLLNILDHHLSQWQQDEHSIYFSILDKWRNPHRPLPAWVKQAILFTSLLLLLTALIALILRQRLRQKAAQLQDTTQRLLATLDALPDLMFEVDAEGRYLDYHSPRTDLLAAPPEVFLGRTINEMLPPEAAATCMKVIQESLNSGTSHGRQIVLELPTGQHWFELSASRKPSLPGQQPHVIVLSRDITERKLAEAQVERMRKLYAALSECNQAIVRCANEAELFPIVCRVAVEFGGMKMAWIGMEADGLLKPVARYGSGIEYLEGIEISTNAAEATGRGPSGTAFRENRPYWCQDFQHDAATAAWHERGAKHGWGASASLPLTLKNQVVGAFNLYAAEANAFDEAARNLLLEMAMDISHALGRFADERERQAISARLQESEERYRLAFRTSTDSININRLSDGLYLDVNEGFERVTGWTRNEVIGKTSAEINIWHDPADRQRLVEQLRQHGYCTNLEADFNKRYGGVVHGLMSAQLIQLQGEPCILNITRDITELKQQETALRRLLQAVEQSPNTIVITDLDANIVYANQTFTKVTGYTVEEVLGKNPRILQSGKTPKATYEELWAHLTAGRDWRGELINKRKDGTEYIESALISPVRDATGKVVNYLAIKENITEKRQNEERIHQLAHFDQLTGLPNRALLTDRFGYVLNLARRSGETVAVMFLDLDHFKNINDTLGHTIGDHYLMEIDRRLKAAIRQEDTVSRLGGDEFILLFPATDADGAAQVARKLIEAVSQPFQFEQHELSSTPSIGIALYPADGDSMEALMKNADAAMYRVKQSGRNNFGFFTAEMQAHSERTLLLQNALRHALVRDEFRLYYQPQVRLADGKVTGAEALLRWRHPQLGEISPTEFIPLAESSGLIVPIGEWVLKTAAHQLHQWQQHGMSELTVAVNLSAVQFRRSDLPDRVSHLLRQAGLPPQSLELELTEAVAMDDPQAAIAMMDKLHARGVRMSIDDFGTGYSSLSYLKRFRVHKLKIDQSFVRDIGSDPEDKAIVTAIVNLASILGLHTIAEGVETAEQLAFLRLQGCEEVQGYYFSKPLEAAAFEAFVKAQG